ncbi:MAG TPA: PAS domain S-box protein [Pyrinomonadaceae bacterium]|nr:PAS domain S-box protein [Pyrinomonadaceae bacterium]
MAKILIVDDRPVNRQFLTTLLGYQKHELREASDGVEGLRIAREQRPDLIISDVLMPTMDGYEFVRRLRQGADIGKTPVIFSTAHYLSRESQALAEKCGVTSIIFKPCEPQAVLDIVAGALAGKVAAAPARLPEVEAFDREHQQLLTNKLAEKTEALRDAHGKLTALIELSTDLAAERDPVELLDRYCSVAREVIGARWTMVVFLDEKLTAIQHLKAIGLDLEDSPKLHSDLLKSGVFKTVISEGRTICLSDVTSTPAELQLPKPLPRAASLVVAPLEMRGQIYGWICLADKLGFDAFSEQDEQLALAMAAKMAVAYDNARLYSDSMKYASKLETEISARGKVELELSESQARLSGIIDSAMDSIITVNSDQQIVMFNEAAEKMFRCTAGDVVGQPLDRLIPPRFHPRHGRDIRKFGETSVAARTMAATRAVSGLRADGEEFPAEASISQVEIGGQKLYTVIMRDISERSRAQEALQTSELRYRRLFESAKDGILVLDSVTGQIVDVNPFLIEMLGFSKEDLVDKKLWEIGVFNDIIASKDAFVELQEMGYLRYEDLPLQTRDGVVKQVEFVSNSYLVNGTCVIQCNIRDITERKKSEQALRESEQQLRLFNHATNDMFWNWELVTDQVTRSIGFERVCGYADQEIIPVAGWWEDRLHPEDHDRVLNAFQTAVAIGDETCSYEYRFRKLDGSYATISDRAYLFRDSSGKVVRAMGAMTDITERKRAEEALQETNQDLEHTLAELREKTNELSTATQQLWQASKLATMGELAASIAHELNNPLATVALRTETLLSHLPADSEHRKPLEIIAQEVDRMAALVNNLLLFSRRGHRQVSTVDVREEIDKSIELVHYLLRSHEIEVLREYADPLPAIHADRQQLCQLFLNLLTNATDAMPRGGKLSLRAAPTFLNGSSAVTIEFEDTGEGISAENLDKVWEPFFTTKQEGKGTGLGMAICRRIVEEHGGSIEIQSEVGRSTTVQIVFPATSN